MRKSRQKRSKKSFSGTGHTGHVGSISKKVSLEDMVCQPVILNDKAIIMERLLEDTKQKLDAANIKYRNVTQQYATIKEQLIENEGHRQARVALQEKINSLEKKYFAMVSKAEVAQACQQSTEISYEELKRNLIRARIALGEKEQEIARLHTAVQRQKSEVIRVKSHFSYRLGYALIMSGKSWRHLIRLPVQIWQIYREMRRRRVKLDSWKQQLTSQLPPTVVEQAKLVRELKVLPKVENANKLRSLKIACVMDAFTYESYAPEALLLQLTPDRWLQELEAFRPDLLFIESAWRGAHELWGNKVGHTSQELVGIVDWCRQQGVPTLFWNKEDPVHFETFLNTARLFDHIFTTDFDCIGRYKKALGHEHVYFLPFAAQPKMHNPIEKFDRQDKFCFAGAYYVKYPERTRDLNNFIITLPEFRDIDIYDRNFGKSDPNYMFPDDYQPYIVGTLPYDQIDKAYKGYNYAINLNSIKQSQTMFARRVYELLASNTITVSNFSHGLRLLFGDLVFTSDSGEEIVNRLQRQTGDILSLKQFRLMALRKIMQEHTYQDRINYIYSKLSGGKPFQLMPEIHVISYANSQNALNTIIISFQRQLYSHKTLTVIHSGFIPDSTNCGDDVTLFSAVEAEARQLDQYVADKWLATFVAEDYYGPDYLTDLALATRYVDQPVIGKKGCFRWQGKLIETYPGAEYKPCDGLSLRQSLLAGHIVPAFNLRQWSQTLYTWRPEGYDAFAIDSLNYCMDGAGYCETLVPFTEAATLDTGLSLAVIQKKAESVLPSHQDIASLRAINPDALAGLFRPCQGSQCVVALHHDKFQIASSLPDGRHEYWYASQDFTAEELGARHGELTLYLETSPGLNLQLAVIYLDAAKKRLGHAVFPANKNSQIHVPADARFLRLGLRVYAAGVAEISNLYLEAKPLAIPEKIIYRDYLVLTNNYASYDDLYKNAFVHTRVKAYRDEGVMCDVFRFKPDAPLSYHEFENVDITTGGKEVLAARLVSNRYQAILVHFLDAAMWDVLQGHIADTRIIVWCHGSDIQSYRRRSFLYEDDIARDKAQRSGEVRDAFWKQLLSPMPANLHMVFVSRYLLRCVEEDLGVKLPPDQYSIIPNPIDTHHFNYQPKSAEQRKKILSIRPYASKVYANDLSVKAILELSKEPFFSELEFRIVGDGVLFEETLAPLRGFSNVIIERRFLSQREIADLHKEYGVFLCPSRMDTQGVSRDEARSSGLVAVTSRVAAIPDFVDDDMAILAEPEDFSTIASGIALLFKDVALFEKLSTNSVRHVRENYSANKILLMEIGVINGY